MSLGTIALIGGLMFLGGGFVTFASSMSSLSTTSSRTPLSIWVALAGFIIAVAAGIMAAWQWAT